MSSFYRDFERYAYSRIYDSKSVDLIPNILCNVFDMKLILFTGQTGISDVCDIEDGVTSFHLILQKCGEHYNDFAPIVPEPLWLPGHAHIDNKDISKNVDINDCEDKHLPVMSDCVDCSDEPKDFLYELKLHRKNNHSNLITGSLNINSLRNKFDIVHYLLKCQYIDILALCETKLDDSFPKCQFDVPGYNCIRKDRSRNGGGLLYYIRSDYPHHRRDNLEHVINSHMGFELIIMELTPNHKEKWLYALGYKPPEIKKLRFRKRISIFIWRHDEWKL